AGDMTLERCKGRLLFATLLIPAVLTFGSCGGSSDDAATPTTAPGVDGASAPSSTTAEGNDGGSGDATGDFRDRAQALEGRDDVFTPDAVAEYQNLLEVAPDEARPYLGIIIEYLEAIAPAGTDPAAAQRVAEISQQYADASVRFHRYVNKNC
ncbi:MAG: hypothetical protein ACKO04_00810, partial [Actinomycetes bacterium]